MVIQAVRSSMLRPLKWSRRRISPRMIDSVFAEQKKRPTLGASHRHRMPR